jgi:hypothetical protein
VALGLIVDSQSFDIEGAWKHNRSLRRLRSTIRTRGDNAVIAERPGRKAFAPIRDEVVVDMELMVFGRVDGTGTPHADVEEGLDENLAYLEDWVLDRTDGSVVTCLAQLETRSGRTFEADVQLLNWQILQENVTQVVIGYDIRIPLGMWTETTP